MENGYVSNGSGYLLCAVSSFTKTIDGLLVGHLHAVFIDKRASPTVFFAE